MRIGQTCRSVTSGSSLPKYRSKASVYPAQFERTFMFGSRSSHLKIKTVDVKGQGVAFKYIDI